MIELLIVMVSLSILAAIAYPSYLSYRVRANRSAVQSVIMDMASRQQLYFLDTRSYTTSNATLGYTALPGTISPYYAIAVTNAAGPPAGFAITATPASGTMQAQDGTLVLSSNGTRTGKW